ncbi:sugar dehydrogenase complex small subunit [Pendulispora albinea]|uniref:Sorbitol dehydrogenase family protein n=1 Tax=Pendulispora albinea TaxID=2741071 RepID=A0ABZ2LLC1_9BACT
MNEPQAPADDLALPPLTRRALLAAFGALAMASSLAGAGCSSPDAETHASSLPEALRREPALARFLHLSVLLTGFEELAPSFGRLYSTSLEADPQRAADLQRLYRQAGYRGWHAPRSLEELEARGIFDDPTFRALTDRIITNWYTGVYEGPSGIQMATYIHALGWHLDGIHAPTTRGGPPGFWSKAPVVR